MRAAFAALAALLLSAPGRALDPRLAAAPDVEPGSFPALALSPGPGRPVCARATFDRRKAAGGGWIYVVDAGEAGDEDAIRMSEAVIARRGGLASRAAILARRHGVAAASLGRGTWDSSGTALILREPVFGAASDFEGLTVRAASGDRERALREGDAACVDAAAGRVILPPPDEADARVAAARAASAYDGLRDEAALERWLEASPGEARAEALLRELAPRALDGSISSAELTRIARAARASAGADGREALERAERRAWSRELNVARADLSDCARAAADAPSTDVLDRLVRDAMDESQRAAMAGAILGGGNGGAPGLARACRAVASRRRGSLPASASSLDAAAAAAGAARGETGTAVPDAWRAFVAENGLDEFLSRTEGDASLGLRRKSQRLRERLLGARLDPATEAGRAIAAAASCPCLVSGADATLPAADAPAALTAARRVWAASFDPGPLGARLRAGARFDGTLRFSRAPKADVSGLLFSREPGSGRRRISVEAAPGPIGPVVDASAPTERYVLEPGSGRALEFVPAGAGADAEPALSPERLVRLARLARALDAWRGGGVEAAFSFDGERLFVHSARALETPPPPRPLSDPLNSPPPPEALGVKGVR